MEKISPYPLTSPSHHQRNKVIPILRNIVLTGWRNRFASLLLMGGFVLFLALVQFSTPDLPDNDGFYHIKLAYLMRTEGLKPDFPYLPLSILNEREFYDHHFLYHVALMPFTFGDLRVGAKLAAVIFASLAFLSAWNLLKNQRIPYAWLWSLGLLAVSEAFIYRMSITRAQSLSLAVMMLAFDWLLRKKTLHLGVLAFLYVWLYDAFPLLPVISGIYVLASWLIERRLDVRPFVFILSGTVLGMIINPYFPHNVVFAALHILPKLLEADAVRVGNEWYPYATAQLLENSLLALAAFVSGAFALGLSGKRMDLRTLFSFALACLFGLMLFQSRRFIEYFPAFALIFAAFAWTPIFTKRLEEEVVDESAGLEQKKTTLRLGRFAQVQKRLPALALIAVLVPGILMTFTAARSSIQDSKPHETYAGASEWLRQNTPAASRIFQTDWDDFPRLFFYNNHNTYLIGLDPTYMHIYDAELYALWVSVTQGKIEQPSRVIEQAFGAKYVLTDLHHGDFIDQAAQDPNLQEVYSDEFAIVYQINGETAQD